MFHSIGLARDRHLDTPREVQIMLASCSLREWDPTFVAAVARDGRVHFARGPLPAALTASGAVEERAETRGGSARADD
ncbi:MAG: hypothetical protein PVSMB4_00430 [Ktedonobacterales bacterium]